MPAATWLLWKAHSLLSIRSRLRTVSAYQVAAGRHAIQVAGPGLAVAEAARLRRLPLDHRDRRGGGDQHERRQPDSEISAAGGGHRRGDPRWVGGSAGEAGEAGAADA